jgi:hypothetical protein
MSLTPSIEKKKPHPPAHPYPGLPSALPPQKVKVSKPGPLSSKFVRLRDAETEKKKKYEGMLARVGGAGLGGGWIYVLTNSGKQMKWRIGHWDLVEEPVVVRQPIVCSRKAVYIYELYEEGKITTTSCPHCGWDMGSHQMPTPRNKDSIDGLSDALAHYHLEQYRKYGNSSCVIL